MTKKTVKATKPTDLYKATIKVLGQVNEATGKTPIEAISNLAPKNCKGRGILIVQKGDKRIERILPPNQVFRLFNSIGFMKEIALKNINILFSNL